MTTGLAEAGTDGIFAEGEASSVQSLHVPFEVDQIAALSSPNGHVVLAFDHPHHRRMAGIDEATRPELTTDCG